MSFLLASLNELPVVEPLKSQWLTDQVARLGLGFGWFFFGHGVYTVYLTGYRQIERYVDKECRRERQKKNWWSS